MSLLTRIGIATKALIQLLYFKPAYLFLALATSVIFYEITYWSLNLGLFHYLLTTKFLALSDKIDIIVTSYTSIFSSWYPLLAILFVVSLLQGATVAALVYSIRKERFRSRDVMKNLGGAGAAGALSVLGLGCSACGTSLVMPLLTFFFASSSAAIADQVGLYSAFLALIVSLVATYMAGYSLSSRLDV